MPFILIKSEKCFRIVNNGHLLISEGAGVAPISSFRGLFLFKILEIQRVKISKMPVHVDQLLGPVHFLKHLYGIN